MIINKKEIPCQFTLKINRIECIIHRLLVILFIFLCMIFTATKSMVQVESDHQAKTRRKKEEKNNLNVITIVRTIIANDSLL